MKFTINARALADAVGWVAHALPKRPPVPTLGGILIEAGDDGLALSVFDYDISRRIVADDDQATPSRILLPGQVLAELVKMLPKDELVDVAADDREAVIRCGRSEFALPLMTVDDYPDLPATPAVVGTIDAGVLAEAVAHVAVAAGTDDTLPMLTCVRVELGDDCIVMAATDRYRVVWRPVSWAPALEAPDELGVMIPARVLADIVRGFDPGPVEVAIDGKLAAFASGGRSTTVRLYDEEFIKFKRFAESVKAASSAKVDAAELAAAVKRVALLAERHTPVRLSFTQGQVLVEAGNADVGRAAEPVDAQLDGDDMRIAVAPLFLLDGLHAVGGTARFAMETSTRPVLLTGSGDPGLRYVVVPVRLSA